MGALQNQVALVTGASRGIGRATAERLASEGAALILNYFAQADSEYEADAVQQAVRAVETHGVRALPVEADVSNADAVRGLVGAALDEFGRIDILVNNAGIGRRHEFVTMPEEMWDRVLAVDLKSQFLVSQAVVPGMIERGGGRIVNVASELALIGEPCHAAYCAAKAGVIGLTKSLARELAPHGILVNAVAPGPTDTDMLRPSATEEYRSTLPLQRFGKPAEIAAAIYFLASPDSAWTTGQVLSPNGGAVI